MQSVRPSVEELLRLGNPKMGVIPKKKVPPKSNIDTQNDGLENVTPLKHCYFWYLCWFSGVYSVGLVKL